MKFLKNIAGGDASTRNKGAISLEYILVIVVVVLVCLVGMKIFGGKIGETINNSKDAVVNVADPIITNAEGSGAGSGSGSTPVVNYNYYKFGGGTDVITKSKYDSMSQTLQANYEGWDGDVYQHTASYTNAKNTYNGSALTTEADTVLYGYDVFDSGGTLVEGCVYSTYLENGAGYPPNPSRTINNRTELATTHTQLQ